MLPPRRLIEAASRLSRREDSLEVCKDCLKLHSSVVNQTLNESANSAVKMRGDWSQRATFLKDRHTSPPALPIKCKSCSKQWRGVVYSERTPGRLWRQYLKGGLLGFSVVFLFARMLRADWLPLFSSSETLQLLPPVAHSTTPALSASFSKPYSSHLREEGARLSRSILKDVVKDLSDNSTVDSGNSLGLSKNIRIYIYNLPASFNTDWLKDERCSNHLFAAEVAIHRRLLQSPVRTLEPSEANYLFVPVYVSCNFNTSTGFPSLGHARSLLESAVKLISHKMPYWNRSNGRDHVFVATHDYGPCFHTMEGMASAAGIPSFLRNSVILQTFGRTDKHLCQVKNSVTIPSFVQPAVVKSGWLPELQRRDIWAFFRGKIEIHPKNVSGRVYSRGVRSTIWRKFRRNHRFFIKRTRTPDYLSEVRRSVFCLCPLGWAPWSPRIVESVIFGCVPVIIADKIALPSSHVINWADISITVPEKDVGKLGKILDKVSRTNLSTIQENLWSRKNRQAMLYTDPPVYGDATWQILDLLSRKANRSHQSVQVM